MIAQEYGLSLIAGGVLDQPYALALNILQLRAYKATREQLERATKDAEKPTGLLADLVWDFKAERMERLRGR